jgi:hypothetical protein
MARRFFSVLVVLVLAVAGAAACEGVVEVGGQASVALAVSDNGWIAGKRVPVDDPLVVELFARDPFGRVRTVSARESDLVSIYTELAAVNDAGVVVGSTVIGGGVSDGPVRSQILRWTAAGGLVAVDSADDERALDKSNAGTVVGVMTTPAGQEWPARWAPDGTRTLLEVPAEGWPGAYAAAAATAVNERGDVAGWVGDRAAVWMAPANALRLLGGLGGRAADINESGVVAGTTIAPGGEPGAGSSRATVWPAGAEEPVALGGGVGESAAVAVDDAGGVSGWITVDAAGTHHAAYWTAGDRRLVDLGTLGYQQSEAMDANGPGQIVGYVSSETTGSAARFDPAAHGGRRAPVDSGLAPG